MLVVFPWTSYWDHNYFVTLSDGFRPALESPWLRGAVSGVGAVTLVAGLADLFDVFSRRSAARSATAP